MMISDLERLIDTITREKSIPRDVVIEILESAMEAAARKRYGMAIDIEAQYNDDLGTSSGAAYVMSVAELALSTSATQLSAGQSFDQATGRSSTSTGPRCS